MNVESCSCETIQLSFSGNGFVVSATVSINRLSREHDHPLSLPVHRLFLPRLITLPCRSRSFLSLVLVHGVSLACSSPFAGLWVKAHLRGDTGCCTRPPLRRSSLSLVKAPCSWSRPHDPPKCHRFLVLRVPRRSWHRCGQQPRTDRVAVRCLQNCSHHPASQGICLLKFLCSVSHSLSSAAVPTREYEMVSAQDMEEVMDGAKSGGFLRILRLARPEWPYLVLGLLPLWLTAAGAGPVTGVLADCLTL